MKPKFSKGEDVYCEENGAWVEDTIKGFRYVMNASLCNTLHGHSVTYHGYLYTTQGWPSGEEIMEEDIRKRPQPGEFSFDEIMSQLKQPISKNILTEQ